MRVLPPDEFKAVWEKLKARHAWLFVGENIGHDLCPGWLSFMERLCAQLEDAIPPEARSKICLVQTKEKFGTLRAYLNVAAMRLDFIGQDGSLHSMLAPGEHPESEEQRLYDSVHDLVMGTEAETFSLCQWCGGRPATQRQVGWLVTTACDAHAKLDYRNWYKMK